MFQGRRLCGPSGQSHTQCEHGGGVHKTVTEASCQIPGIDAASADKGRCDGFQPATAAKASQRTAPCGGQCWSFNLDDGTGTGTIMIVLCFYHLLERDMWAWLLTLVADDVRVTTDGMQD